MENKKYSLKWWKSVNGSCGLVVGLLLSVAVFAGCSEQQVSGSLSTGVTQEGNSSSALSSGNTGVTDVFSASLNTGNTDMVGQVESNVPDVQESAYSSGSYVVEAILDEFGREELHFQDGKLVYHYFTRSDIGKGSYGGPDGDEIEYSPYYEKSVEEALELLKQEGYNVTVTNQ